MHEWPLLVFTLTLQTAVGAFWCGEWIRYRWPDTVLPHPLNRLLFTILGLGAAGMAVSFLHLGSPQHAFYALNNFKTSWMSREILAASLFMGALFVYIVLRWKGWLPDTILTWMAAGIGLLGLILIFTMARLYMLAAVPAWNTWITPASFLLTALILGPAVSLLFIFPEHPMLMGRTAAVNLPALALSLVLLLVWLAGLTRGESASVESLARLTGEYQALLIAALVVKLAALSALLAAIRKESSRIFMWGITLAILAGEVLHRVLFYVSYARMGL